MAPKKELRLAYGDGWGETDVRAVEQALDDLLGPRWTGWHSGDAVPDAAVFAQLTESDTGRYVLSGVLLLGDAITADQLRKVPVSAIENSTNLSTGNAHGRMRAEVDALPPLKRTTDMAPEDFSRLVAEHYRTWARYVPHPAAAMAAEWKAKLPTVHTWIREARLRGFLPPARRGKGRPA